MNGSEMLHQIEIGLGEIDSIKGFDKFFKDFTTNAIRCIYVIKESENKIKKVSVPSVSETFSKCTSSVTMEGGEVEDKKWMTK